MRGPNPSDKCWNDASPYCLCHYKGETFVAENQFSDRNIAIRKAAAIARSGIDPEFIALEIEKLIK